MKAASALIVVLGLVVVGCGGAPSSARPTRVDHARTPTNATYAALPASTSSTRVAHAYATAFASARYATPPSYAQAFAQTCQTSDDCGTGDFACRAREDGTRVCMGYGSRGESCWFDADCVSGTCEMTDGAKICR